MRGESASAAANSFVGCSSVEFPCRGIRRRRQQWAPVAVRRPRPRSSRCILISDAAAASAAPASYSNERCQTLQTTRQTAPTPTHAAVRPSHVSRLMDTNCAKKNAAGDCYRRCDILLPSASVCYIMWAAADAAFAY